MNFHSGIIMRPLVVIILEISASYLFCCSMEYDRRTRARYVMLPKQWLWDGCSQQQLELHDFDEWYQLQTCNHLSTTADYLKLLLNLFENMAHFTVILHFYRFPLIPFLRGNRARLTVLVHLLCWPSTCERVILRRYSGWYPVSTANYLNVRRLQLQLRLRLTAERTGRQCTT